MQEEQAETVEQTEPGADEKPVDLNQVFRESELDLNSMFPDGELRNFLRKLRKNHRSNQRFLEGFSKEKFWTEDDGQT